MAQSHKFFEDFDNEREVERQIDDKMYALAAENAGKDVKVIPRGFASATTVGDGIYKTSTSNTTQNSRMGDPITSTEVKQLTKYDLK